MATNLTSEEKENEPNNGQNILQTSDIPGADLDLSRLSSYRVDELKFWLSCRGDSLKCLPTKASCVQRICDYVKNKRDKVLVDPSKFQIYHRGKMLKVINDQKDEEVSEINEQEEEDSTISKPATIDESCIQGDYWKHNMTGWTRDIHDLPLLTIKEIEVYFQTSGKTGKLQKRADTLLYDNFLDNIQCSHTQKYFYIRSICSASYTKATYHKLSCALQKGTAKVSYAFCSCKAGNGGFCNHIYALLKLVGQFVLDKKQEIPSKLPCTSRPCGWTVPKVRKMDVAKPSVMNTTIKKPNLQNSKKGIECTLYEARSEQVRSYNQTAISNMDHELNSFLIRNMTSIADNQWVESAYGKVPIFSPMAYQCSKVGNNLKVYLNIDNVDFSFPLDENDQHLDYPRFPHRDIRPYYIHDPSALSESERSFIKQLSVTDDQAATIEESTRSQSNCAMWFNERKGRVTASRIYDVNNWKRGLDKHAEKFVSQFSGSTAAVSNQVLQKKLEHGVMYEPVAWEKYKLCFDDFTPEVYSCGLVINSSNCWLGCSPDARIVFGNEFGIGESKCPEQYKNCDVFDVASSVDTFMLYVNGQGKLDLRTSHSTYFQIQCQLALTGARFCDLVVYTFKSIAIVRIKFDAPFWEKVVGKVGQMYFKYILPKV